MIEKFRFRKIIMQFLVFGDLTILQEDTMRVFYGDALHMLTDQND